MRRTITCVLMLVMTMIQLWPATQTHASTAKTTKQILATTYNHTCVIHSGTIWCWGTGSSGQLGDQTFRSQSSAVQVKLDDQPLSNITMVSTGADHTCALQTGKVYCWGRNMNGQIGVGHTVGAPEPTQSIYASGAPVQGIKQVSAGHTHTCVITARDTVLCWGGNSDGQLGDNSTTDRYTAVPVRTQAGDTLSGVTAIASGYNYTCAIAAQTVYCWGANTNGKLGDGTTTARSYAAPVLQSDGSNFTGVSAISTGYEHACALKAGNVYCWGDNGAGQLGDATTDMRMSPVQVINADTTPLTRITRINAGGAHSCATTSTQTMCWGSNSHGQLGNRTTVDSTTPVTVLRNATTPLANPTAIATGAAHTCVISETSSWCVGQNNDGQLADGTLINRTNVVTSRYRSTQPLLNVTKLVGGGRTICGLRGGQLFCWGDNSWGQFQTTAFDASSGARLVTIKHNGQPLLSISDIVFYQAHACALSGGRVYCWGSNWLGQLGDGTTNTSSEAVLVRRQSDNQPLTGVTSITIGQSHSCAVSLGTVYCWGDNGDGQLGDNSNTDRELAVPVQYQDGSFITDATSVKAGINHSCALRQQNVYCWGNNYYSSLGDTSNTNRNYAALVVKLGNTPFTNVSAISAGGHHYCAIQNQRVWCWGSDSSDQLGDGEYTSANMPGAVLAKLWRYKPLNNVSALMSGSMNSCALRGDTMLCWGDNTMGQIGDATTTDREFAVPVRNADLAVLTKVRSMLLGTQVACAIVDKNVMCWGANGSGQLGNNNRHIHSSSPVTVLMHLGNVITGIR